jgi:hypothetical protein
MRIRALTAILVSLWPLHALAEMVTYDFTVNGGPSGPLAGVVSSGSITFDTNEIAAATLDSTGSLLFVSGPGILSDMRLNWDGIAYDPSTLQTGGLTWLPNGFFSGWLFGTHCDGAGCGVTAGSSDLYVNGSFPGGGPFVYTVSGVIYDGVVTSVTQAPLDPTVWYLAAGLLGLAAVKIRFRASDDRLVTPSH